VDARDDAAPAARLPAGERRSAGADRDQDAQLFNWTTSLGQSAHTIADGLADKVNAHHRFKAVVEHHADGSATLRFARR
jgi:hypothetical protein